jgi:hypothetical protein
MDCLLDNLSALTAHLQFPVEQRERIRHTNLLERTFGESRRRVKVIGRLPGENSCLSLVWAVLVGPAWAGAGSRPRSQASGDCRTCAISSSAHRSCAQPADRARRHRNETGPPGRHRTCRRAGQRKLPDVRQMWTD